MKDDSISLGTNRSVPICSICHVRTEDNICPQCQRAYDPEHEITQYEDTLLTGYEDETPEIEGIGGGIDLIVDNEDSATADLYKSQKRLGVRPTENVVYYEEYVPYVDRED